MEWSDYIVTVKDQIRNKKAKLLIEDELKDHMEEQIKAYQCEGYSLEEAEAKAVLDMGDPVEVGTQFNRVHRPKLGRKLVILIALFGLFGLFIQYLVGHVYIGLGEPDYFQNQVYFTLIGIVVMVAIYFIDYTIIGKYPLLLWGGLYLLSLVHIRVANWHYGTLMEVFHIVYLFLPLFAGVLFQLRKWKVKGLLLSGLIGASPLLLAVYGRNSSALIHYGIIVIIMLNIAVAKRWFQISKKLGFLILWGGIASTMVFSLLFFYVKGSYLFSAYQMMRFKAAFFHPVDDSFLYLPNIVKKTLNSSLLLGRNSTMIQQVPIVESDYILVFICNMFGILVGVVVVGLLLVLMNKAFGMAKRQRSNLGFMVGMACVLSLFVQSMFYIASNLGVYRVIFLVSQQGLPFLSGGIRNTVYTYAIFGLLLSVYRNSELVSDNLIAKRKLFKGIS